MVWRMYYVRQCAGLTRRECRPFTVQTTLELLCRPIFLLGLVNPIGLEIKEVPVLSSERQADLLECLSLEIHWEMNGSYSSNCAILGTIYEYGLFGLPMSKTRAFEIYGKGHHNEIKWVRASPLPGQALPPPTACAAGIHRLYNHRHTPPSEPSKPAEPAVSYGIDV